MKKLIVLLGAPLILVAHITEAASLSMQMGGGADYRVSVASLKEVRFKTTVRQQYDFSCGSAALATLLTYHYGYPVSEKVVFEEMYRLGDQYKIRKEGFSLLDIKRFLEARGFRADGFLLPLDKLEGARLPAIVLIAEKGYRHFVVIKGIRDDRVLIGDPASGTRAIPRNSFESMWINKLLFVVHNNRQLARFNQTLDWHAAPKAPLHASVNPGIQDHLAIPKFGPGDF